MAIKMLISDLDGTLLGADSRIAPRTANALNQARRAGLRILVATGRTWRTASPLLWQAGVVCDFVLLNGAEYRTAEGDLQRFLSLPLDDARYVVDILQQYNLGFEINADKGDFSTDTMLCNTAKPMPCLPYFWANNPQIRKIFAFSQDQIALNYARQALSCLSETTVTASAPWNLEVTARQAQKGNMALWAVSQYGLTQDEVLVFGDGYNDESLFQAFVHTRAMGNAVAPLQAIAERIIEPNTEHGVACEIERLLFGKAETIM